ncbi:MAG: aldo/keto reductase, partial [Candidatus Zipacnadales bacterium]
MMKKRTLGRTGLDVTIVSYGCIKLPNIDENTAAECLTLALDLGINFFDTARNYRDSETKIGKAISHRRDEFYIATKTTNRSADGLRAELETSLTNLRMDSVDLYQLHSVSDDETWRQVMAPGGALEGARRAQEEGLVRHVGITIHRALPVMRAAIESGEFATLMVAYSPLDQEGVAAEIIPLAAEREMGVIIMKALSGGTLALPESERPPEGDPIVRDSLRWVLQTPGVTCVIPGMQSIQEVRENCATGEAFQPLTHAEQRVLFEHLAPLSGKFRYEQFCLRCGYCQPCPNEVTLADIFRALTLFLDYPPNLQQ